MRAKTAAIAIETKPKISADDFLGHPERVDNLSSDQLRELALQISQRAGQIRDVESHILYRFLCDRNPDINSDGFPHLLDAKQLAQQLGVPESWVREQARLGKLPSIKLGHYVRFRLDEVKQYLDKIAATPAKTAVFRTSHVVAPENWNPEDDEKIVSLWPPPSDSGFKTVRAEIADVLIAWKTVLWAHAVDEKGFVSKQRNRLARIFRKPA